MTDAIKRAKEKARHVVQDYIDAGYPLQNRVELEQEIYLAIHNARNEGRNDGLEEAAAEADRHGDPQIRDAIEALKVRR